MRIVPRSEWGAVKEQARPPMRLPAVALWLHHTVTNPTGDPHADMRAIQRIGISRFGYLSYSFAVHPDGTILEGQGTRVGAHTALQNSSSFGVVLIGNYEERRPTDTQVDAVRWLVAHLLERKALKAGVYPTGGHRDAPGAGTVCPGGWAMDRLKTMRVPWTGLTMTKKVYPLYSPALDLEPIVADLACPTGGAWLLAASGAVYAFGGAPFLGGPAGKDYFAGRVAARLEPVDGKYAVRAESGEVYGPGF